MTRTPTQQFLTGRKAHVQDHVHRTDDGTIVPDTFLVVGPSPWLPDFMQVQDVIDGIIETVPTDAVIPIA